MHQLFFYLLLLLLPTQLGFHFWPDWALVLGRRVDYLSPTLYVTDILIFLTVFFWIIDVFSRSWYHVIRIMGKTIIHNTSTIIPFLLCIFTNMFFAQSRPVAIYTWVKFFEFFLLGYYIVKTKPNILLVSCLLSLSVLYSSVLAIAQFALQHSIGGALWFLGERTFTAATPGIAQIPLCFPGAAGCPLYLRPYATFPHPNVLGGFLAVVLPLVLFQLSVTKHERLRLFFITTFLSGLIALVLTFSRSAWIVGALGIGMTYFVLRKSRKYIAIGAIFLVACLLFLVAASVRVDSESVVVRRELAAAAVKIWQTAPLSGAGLGNFLVAIPRYLPDRTVYFLQPVHNIYLLLFSETGIIGLLILVWLVYSVIRDKRKVISKTYFLSLIAYLSLGLIDHYPVSLQQGRLLLTLFIALSLV